MIFTKKLASSGKLKNACFIFTQSDIVFAPKYNISSLMGYLKGKTATIIFDKHANLKYKFGNKHFRSTGYYVSVRP